MYGVDDRSIPPLVANRAGTPIHLPLMFTFSAKGDPGEAYVVSGDAMKKMFGDEILDPKSPYATINTPYIELFNRKANEMMIQRLVADDATTASFRLFAEVLETKVPNYLRNPDGSIEYDAQGQPKQSGEVDGVLIVWRAGEINELSGLFRAGKVFDGTLTNASGGVSKIYPILDMPAPYVGAKPSDFGFSLSCPNIKSTVPVNADIVSSIGARVMTIQFYDQRVKGQSPSIIRTLSGQTSVNFSFKPGAYYAPMRMELDADDVVMANYRKMNPDTGYTPELGPVKDFYVYRDNLELIANLALTAIADPELTDPYMVDIFSGLDVYGNPYNGVVVDDGANDGEILNERHVHYLIGGSDGTMNAETFDALVRREMLEFGEGKVNYLNILKYPCNFFWDTGFSIETKEAIGNFIGRLKTTNVCWSTHIHGHGPNTMQEEESMKVAVAAMARAHPESVRYGTGTMRGVVVGHSMRLHNNGYKHYVPASYSLAAKVASYAGAGQGRFKSEYKFSRGELAIIDEGFDLNLRYKPHEVYSSDWETGLISIRSYDQYRYHFPALYTVYENDRSVCNNFLVALIVAHLNYLAQQTWAEITGVSDMTDGEVVAMVNRKLTEKTEGIYDGVVTIVPDAYFTPEDKSNGYSISVDLHLYGAVMKTVMKTTVVAHRNLEG
jgi:hypothetical protein